MTAPLALTALLLLAPLSTTTPRPTPDATTVQVEGEKQQDDEKKKKEARDTSKFNVGKDGLGIQGYDPVSYFKEGGGKPKKGDKKITLTHDGITYRFVSRKNLELFEKDPAKYEPLYGGWCAYAMSSDDRVEIDPKSFLVTDEGLFLFYDSFLANTRKKWNKEGPAKLKPKADKNWAAFLVKKKEK